MSSMSLSSEILTTHPRQTAPSAAALRWTGPPGVRVVLGSKSFTRKLLLGELGVPFECISPDIDEKAIRDPDPAVLVMKLAHAKADALLAHLSLVPGETEGETLLLTSDQVVVFEGEIREKPESEEEARTFIRGYGRSPCRTVGAIVVTNLATGKCCSASDTASIHFSLIPEEVIEAIVAEGTCLSCAGGLMVEDPKVQPYLERIEGGMDSVMGLGKETTLGLLNDALRV